jgi:hypothetical protein
VDCPDRDKGLVHFIWYLTTLADKQCLEKPPAREGGVLIEKGLYPLPPAIEPPQEGVSPLRTQNFYLAAIACVAGDQDAKAPQVSCIVEGAWVEEVARLIELGLEAYSIAVPHGDRRISEGDPHPADDGNDAPPLRDSLGHKVEYGLLGISLRREVDGACQLHHVPVGDPRDVVRRERRIEAETDEKGPCGDDGP